MRNHVLLIAIVLSPLAWLAAPLTAQESSPAPAAPAVHQENDEYYKALQSRVEELERANETAQKNLSKLHEQLQKLSDEVTRVNDHSKDAATMDAIKQLKSAIEEVDKKRIEDQKLVLSEFQKIMKILEKPVPSAPTVKPATPKSNGNGTSHTEPSPARENGYNYTIRANDTLSGIVTALKKQGMKISQKQVTDANPTVNWTKLKVGQVIFIPSAVQ